MARLQAARSLLFAVFSVCLLLPPSAGARTAQMECPVSFSGSRSCTPLAPKSFLPANVLSRGSNNDGAGEPDLPALSEILDGIAVMQDEYFAAWLGTWPASIDWTGAVIGTHVSGTLRTFSEALALVESSSDVVEDWKLKENLIENYFGQVVSYYFGENAFEIRQEAYDDILWVVLGWLEAVRFINDHTDLHYRLKTQIVGPQIQNTETVGSILRNQTWHGNLWIPAFSHRARVFWDLSSKGWDTKLCGGGMTWNPRLLPYKNAITNELFIAASISMYLFFPGDNNMAPFSGTSDVQDSAKLDVNEHASPRDPKFLKAAVDGYKWLVGSNMTDASGLFTDGFHVSGYSDPADNNTKCDERNNMVFTYNQGVLLTGQRGLWEATGAPSYLAEGHQLIQNVINATGYDLENDRPRQEYSSLAPGTIPRWYGLGRLGIMEDNCDASGTCSQNGQTFKGIFFHHLSYFCTPLNAPPPNSGLSVDDTAFKGIKNSHNNACARYSAWLKWNTEAALGTRDRDGKFGMWWTAGLLTNFTGAWPTMVDDGIDHQAAGIDYRNHGVPNDTTWRLHPPNNILDPGKKLPIGVPFPSEEKQQPLDSGIGQAAPEELRKRGSPPRDPNRRGRGRTVETQGSGVALIRAYWHIARGPR
ncbi:glycosyl hydrolase [Seiridium cupressi]